MPEPDASSDVEQVRILRGHERVVRDAEAPCGTQDERRIPERVGGGHQQQPPGGFRQPFGELLVAGL
jgi:hypothetical protein